MNIMDRANPWDIGTGKTRKKSPEVGAWKMRVENRRSLVPQQGCYCYVQNPDRVVCERATSPPGFHHFQNRRLKIDCHSRVRASTLLPALLLGASDIGTKSIDATSTTCRESINDMKDLNHSALRGRNIR